MRLNFLPNHVTLLEQKQKTKNNDINRNHVEFTFPGYCFTHEDDFLRHSHVEIVTETAVVVAVETGRPVIGHIAVHPDAFGHLHLVADLLGEIRIVHPVVHLDGTEIT